MLGKGRLSSLKQGASAIAPMLNLLRICSFSSSLSRDILTHRAQWCCCHFRLHNYESRSGGTFSSLSGVTIPSRTLHISVRCKSGTSTKRTPVRFYCSSTSSSDFLCTHLKERTLIKVAGKDATDFLQGLITNDMRVLDPDSSSVSDEDKEDSETSDSRQETAMYAMMLNIQGRVMYDMLVYRLLEETTQPFYLLECDVEVATEFLKVVKRYKLRKKVDLGLVGDNYQVWSVTPSNDASQTSSELKISASESAIVAAASDPRIPTFGHRLLLRTNTKGSDAVASSRDAPDSSDYHRRRYVWGLPEGTVDLPPGNCTPLESNLVFLNGVSFSKGCYIGQELTARTHHTGVIRKRLMPVKKLEGASDIEPGFKVENSGGKNCGKFRNSVGDHGMALLRIGDVIGKGPLLVKNDNNETVGRLDVVIPDWWPTETDVIITEALEKSK